jgi:hypothetical protein
VTNALGQVGFTLPQGDYRFRVDKPGNQFWSGTENHCTVPGCTEVTVTTKDAVVVTVLDINGDPEAGLDVRVYDGETFTGFGQVTNAQGRATIWLAAGDYRFRAEKNGTMYWSGEENHCTVPGCAEAVITTDSGGMLFSMVPPVSRNWMSLKYFAFIDSKWLVPIASRRFIVIPISG